MVGIVGIVNGGSSPERLTRALGRLMDHCRIDAGGDAQPVVRGGAALAVMDHALPSTVASTAVDQGVILGVFGRIFDEALSDRFGRPRPHDLLTRFFARGVAAFESLNGEYLIAVWEVGPRRLTIVNDRFGLRRLYYWAAGHRLVFAPSLTAFTFSPEFPRTIDEFALADYLSVGHHLDGRTWYSAVRLLLPASVLTFVDGRLSQRTYWQFELSKPRRISGIDDWTAQYRWMLESAVRRRLPAPEVSVGLWSADPETRQTLSALLRKNGRHELWTIPPDPSGDSAGHITATDAPQGPAPGVIDGYLPCTAARLANLLSMLPTRPGVLFSGRPASVVNFPLRRSTTLLPNHDPKGTSYRPLFRNDELRQILRPEVYRLVQGVTADSLERSYADAPGPTLAEKTTAVWIRQHQQHDNPLDLERFTRSCRVVAPYLDRDVVEAAQTPAEHSDDPESEDLSAFGEPPRRCHHAPWETPRILRLDDELLGGFFRPSRLKQLLQVYPEGGPMEPEKLCALVGIGDWLAGAHGLSARQRHGGTRSVACRLPVGDDREDTA